MTNFSPPMAPKESAIFTPSERTWTAGRCCVFVLLSSDILINFADIIMAEAQNPLRRLRSNSLHFLGLKEEDTLPPGGLPTNKNVLEVILMQ